MTTQQTLLPCTTEGCTLKRKPAYDQCYQCSMKAKGYIICGVDGCTQLKDPQFQTCYNHNQRQPANKQQVATPEAQQTTPAQPTTQVLLTEEEIQKALELIETMEALELGFDDVVDQVPIRIESFVEILNMKKVIHAMNTTKFLRMTSEEDAIKVKMEEPFFEVVTKEGEVIESMQ